MIPAAEWQRIRGSLSQRERERQEQCEARQHRQDRKLQSQDIVKHWENTIEVCCSQCSISRDWFSSIYAQGQRLKKLKARELREEREEEEKLKIDREEMEYQAQCRTESIQRAKTLLYQQTDRVKTFHVRLK